MTAEQTFEQRCRTYNRLAAEAAHEWYDDAGDWIAPGRPLIARERYWLCCALYALGENAFADAIVRKSDIYEHGPGISFDIFHTNIAAMLLTRHQSVMAGDVVTKLQGLVRDGFSFKPGNRSPEFQFHGYNDNMPAETCIGLLLGGKVLGDAAAVAHGEAELRQFRAELTRRGINSEFNSPTYSPVTLHGMAEVAEHAENPQARALALELEHRLWIDMAARFHPETGVVAGPWARAYQIDLIAHVSNMASMLWCVLGDIVNPSPLEFFANDPDLVVHHDGDYPFNIAQACWFTTGVYHVPEAALRLFRKSSHAFHAVASAELGDFGPDIPACQTRIETFLQPDYTVGACTYPFAGGELSYSSTYRRTAPVKSYRDVGTIYSKMAIDDQVPGFIVDEGGYSGEGYLVSQGISMAVQSESTALVLSHPRLHLGGPADVDPQNPPAPPKPISRLSDLVIFPSHHGGVDELIVGGQPRAEWSGEVPHGAWIAARRGRLLIAIRPLAYSLASGHAQVTLERANKYDVIRETLYQGDPKVFTRHELRRTVGGFVAEHASVDDFPSLQSFADSLAASTFLDYTWTTRWVRYRRPKSSARPSLEIEAAWSPGSTVTRFIAIDGKRLETPIVAIDGIDPASLPFLGSDPPPTQPYFPWQKGTDNRLNLNWIVGDVDAE